MDLFYFYTFYQTVEKKIHSVKEACPSLTKTMGIEGFVLFPLSPFVNPCIILRANKMLVKDPNLTPVYKTLPTPTT